MVNLLVKITKARKDYQRFGLDYYQKPKTSTGVLFVHPCCRGKRITQVSVTPDKLYQSKYLKRFVRNCIHTNKDWAILSDLHGFVMPDDLLLPYEHSPGQMTNEDLWTLGAQLRRQFALESWTSVHFVGTNPFLQRPYLIIMLASGIPFTYSTKAPASSVIVGFIDELQSNS